MTKTVVIDPGHGGKDSGAVYGNLIEKHMALVTAKACRDELVRQGVKVIMTRETDVFLELSQRARIANNAKADYFVSIHYNAGGGDGVEAIHSIYRGAGETLANNIVNAIHNETGQNFRPRKTYAKKGNGGTDYHAVIRQTSMHAVIVEGAFVDSADRFIVDTAAEQQKMGVAIAHGILATLGIAVKKFNTAPSTSGKKLYKVQIGAFKNRNNANNLLNKAKQAGFDAFIAAEGGLYKVQIGAYSVKENAVAQLNKAKRAGFSAFIA